MGRVGGDESGVKARVGRRSGRRTEAEERERGEGAQERELARVSAPKMFLSDPGVGPCGEEIWWAHGDLLSIRSISLRLRCFFLWQSVGSLMLSSDWLKTNIQLTNSISVFINSNKMHGK
jgi:hypothetical protein